MNWKEYALALLLFNVLGILRGICSTAPSVLAPLNPMGFGAVSPGLLFQYGGKFRHQYQLAGLWRRNHDELSDPDAGPGGAELPLGRNGHGRARRLYPRLCPRHRRKESAISGWTWCAARSISFCPSLLSWRFDSGLSGRGAELPSLSNRSARSQPTTYEKPKLDADGQPLKDAKGNPVIETVGKRTGLASWAGSLANRHQAAGHQRRRLFQRQLRPSFRKPDPVDRISWRCWPFCLSPAALCYTFGKMVGDTRQGWAVLAAMTMIFCVCFPLPYGRNKAAIRRWPRLGVDQTASTTAAGRQHGRQRGAVRSCQLRLMGDGHDRRLQRFGELHARFLYPPRRNGADVADATG